MSLTILALFGGTFVTILMSLGFSEQCSNELINVTPLLVGSAFAWYGRWRKGDVKWWGGRK